MQLDHVLKSVNYVQGLSLQAQNGTGWGPDKVPKARVLVCIEANQTISCRFAQFAHSAHSRNRHGLSEIARPVGPVVNQ